MRINNKTLNVIMCASPNKIFIRPGVSDIPDSFLPHVQKYIDWGWMEIVKDKSSESIVVVGNEPTVVTSKDPDTIVVGDNKAEHSSNVIVVKEDVSEAVSRPKEPEPVEQDPNHMENMSKKELNKIAKDLGIDKPTAMTKAKLIRRIKEIG